MGGGLSQLDWVGLVTSIVGHHYSLSIEGNWTSIPNRLKYTKWSNDINTWMAIPGWAMQPIWLLLWSLQAAAIFLLWRNEYDSISADRFTAIIALQIASVFFQKLWTPVFLWGKRFFLGAVALAFLALATSTTVWGLIGAEHAWLPFGLYALTPILMVGVLAMSSTFWWYGEMIRDPAGRFTTGLGRGIEGFGRTVSGFGKDMRMMPPTDPQGGFLDDPQGYERSTRQYPYAAPRRGRYYA